MIFLYLVITIIFSIFYAYSHEEVDLGEAPKKYPSSKLLFENKESNYHNIDSYDVDKFIQENVISACMYSSLFNRINYYQNKEKFPSALIIIPFISILTGLNFIYNEIFKSYFALLVALIINTAIFFSVYFLYYTPIFKKIRLKNYDKYYYNSHYTYLEDIEESVMFRYFIRKTIASIALILFFLGIWNSEPY